MSATTIVLSGWSASLALLALCAIVCIPVYFATKVAQGWWMRHLKARFNRQMTALGDDRTPEDIDREWQRIVKEVGRG